MTISELKDLVKDGATWAQVENFVGQEIDAVKQEEGAKTKAVQVELESVKALHEKVKVALANQDAEALTSLQSDFSKSAAQLECDSLDAQLATLQAKRNEVAAKL